MKNSDLDCPLQGRNDIHAVDEALIAHLAQTETKRILMKPRCRMENWRITEYIHNNFHSQWQLGGDVINHPRLYTMSCVRTSFIVSIDAKFKVVETHNTIYQLGKVSDFFELYLQENGQTVEEFLNLLESEFSI